MGEKLATLRLSGLIPRLARIVRSKGRTNMKRHVTTVAAGLFLSGSAFADCEMRQVTPAELQHKARAEAALREALPPAPARWTMKASGRDTLPAVCGNDAIGDFPIRV